MSRTLQANDLFNLKFLQGGSFSPDNSKVIYSVSHIDKEEEYITIWLYDVQTKQHRQMTSGKAKDSNPKWSPDSKQIAFISERGDKPQIYLLPVDGGEARHLTQMKQGVGGDLAWSPDGKKIAFTAGVDYGDEEPPDLTKDVYRVTRNVYRFDALGYLDQAVLDIYVIDVGGGEPKRLTNDPTINNGLSWSPDGTKVLYSAIMHPDRFRAMFPEICTVNSKGEIEIIIEESWGNAYNPTFTSDGSRIVFIGLPHGSPIGTKSDLWVHDLTTGEKINRTPNLNVGVGGGLSMDMPTPSVYSMPIPLKGDSAYVRVQTGGTVQIYRVALSGDEAHEAIVSGDRACFAQNIHGGKILYASIDINTPPNLFVANLDGSNEQQITNLNQDLLSTISQPETERLLFNGADGVQVEGWYMKPPVGQAPYPTILYIHGGPHGAYGYGFHFDFQMLAGAGYGVLFINHRASTGYGDEFSTAIKGDWGNLDYSDLMAGVDCAIERGLADADRLGCCGTSGGGNLSCWIVGQTDRFKAAIPQNPVTNWVSFYGVSDIGVWFAVEQLGGHPQDIPEVYARCSPITYAHNCKTPTLMVQSEHDWRCPTEQSEQFYTVLKANGCIVEMLRQPGGSHGASIRGAINLRCEHNTAMLNWFNRYVLEGTTS